MRLLDNQVDYDITEFVVNNKEEIITEIKDRVAPVLNCEIVFDANPSMFHAIYLDSVVTQLIKLLEKQLSLDYMTISLTVDQEFVIVNLYGTIYP